MEPEPASEDEEEMGKEDYTHPNGKKMTDEEKRKNFLERNRLVYHLIPEACDRTDMNPGWLR